MVTYIIVVYVRKEFDRLNKKFVIRLSDYQYKILSAESKRQGISMSSFLRKCIVSFCAVPPEADGTNGRNFADRIHVTLVEGAMGSTHLSQKKCSK